MSLTRASLTTKNETGSLPGDFRSSTVMPDRQFVLPWTTMGRPTVPWSR